MRYNIRKACSLFVFILIIFVNIININTIVKASNDKYSVTLKQDILCFMLAYPEYITGIDVDNKGFVYIKMKSGHKILYDDKKSKTVEQKLDNPDLQDTMEQPYPLNFPIGLMEKNFDPGRFRNYELMREVYGASKGEVQAKLRNVKAGYGYLQFNLNNGAAKELSAAMKEVALLAQDRGDIRKALFPTSGTFNYRYIAGTYRLSPHSFGTAIDLASNKNDYWKWADAKNGEKRLLSYPSEVVRIFEEHNFIWGGKWNHFDILHYEYRPEIIFKARYFSKNFENGRVWYEGAQTNNKEVIDKIKEIDTLIK